MYFTWCWLHTVAEQRTQGRDNNVILWMATGKQHRFTLRFVTPKTAFAFLLQKP